MSVLVEYNSGVTMSYHLVRPASRCRDMHVAEDLLRFRRRTHHGR